MSKSISVIVPTFREPSHLSLCLESLIKGQDNDNEIIVVCDGYRIENQHVLDKWKDNIKVLDLETNQGLARATNYGCYVASCELILIINDDNVMPNQWDSRLLQDYEDNSVISINQIEPVPSMFRQFYIKNFGRTVSEFNLSKFTEEELNISNTYGKECGYIDNTGSTLPFLISKRNFLMLGGWDIEYNKLGVCVDWDFFLKVSLSHLKIKRTYRVHVYHFVSVSTGTNRQEIERIGHDFAKYKWGYYIQHDPYTNKKYLAR